MHLSEREVKEFLLYLVSISVAALIFKLAFFKHHLEFDKESLQVIKEFIKSKMSDAATVVEAAAMIDFLAKDMPSDELSSILLSSLDSIKSLRFGVDSRNAVFKLVQKHLKSIPAHQYPSFLESFLNSTSDEKDPRNLLIIFECVPEVSKMTSEESLLEELFDGTACYFPITFRASPSDPRLISVESLKAALGRALAAPAFAQLTLSLMLTKLASTSTAAKLDSIEVLCLGTKTFAVSVFASKIYELKIALFAEVFNNAEAKIQMASLKLIRLLCALLPVGEFHEKFVAESLSAIKLMNAEIMSKSAVIIEVVSSASQESFRFAAYSLLKPLIELTFSSEYLQSQASRNCLVALLSPLKAKPDWIFDDLQVVGTDLLARVSVSPNEYGVFLVIFSFVAPILSLEIASNFISGSLNRLSALHELPSDLKNCLWLASQSRPEIFSQVLNEIANANILAAISSTATLAKQVLLILQKASEVSVIEQVIQCADLCEICVDPELILSLVKPPLSEASLVKLISPCPIEIQSACLLKNQEIASNLIIASQREAILQQQDRILSCFSSLSLAAICSLSNKCPELDLCNLSSEQQIASLRGRLWRGDASIFEQLKQLTREVQPQVLASFESESAPEYTYALETHHIRKALWAQRFLNSWIQTCKDDVSATILFSVLSAAPQTSSTLPVDRLLLLLLSFLKNALSLQIPVELRVFCWELLSTLVKSCDLNELVQLCLNASKYRTEPSCQARHKALKILSFLAEDSETRSKCLKWQDLVVFSLKRDALNDPKRIVRHEAARARNLWIILTEEGVFE